MTRSSIMRGVMIRKLAGVISTCAAAICLPAYSASPATAAPAAGSQKPTLIVAISTDYVGHRYGNEGPEMCDQLAHLDRGLGDFFASLDALEIRYVVVLSADHGGIDAAERVQQRGFPAQRITV